MERAGKSISNNFMKGSDSKYQTLNKFDMYMSFLFLNEKCTS